MHLHHKFSKNYGLTEQQAKKAVKLLKHLRYGYTFEVVNMAAKHNIETSQSAVLAIRNGRSKNPEIFNFLIHLAKIEKANAVAVRGELKEL